ncbi:hypothetical protein PV797_01185 [Clostridiaceae bacterium M8S5]|nr:hypothetical protein PV797_01185 [Clostridiaceae bacterium M8S5]
MSENIKILVDELGSKDNKIRKNALDTLLGITNEKVKWIYEVWDIFVEKLDSSNSYQRSIGIFMLSNLVKSDYENRFFDVINKYLELMEDERFITARQTIQSSWKVAIAKKTLRNKIANYLLKMFLDNKHLSSHANLIRKDITQSLVNINNLYKNAVDLGELELKIEMYCDKNEKKKLYVLLGK